MKNEWDNMTVEEQNELDELIARGVGIYERDEEKGRDYFYIELSSGRTVCGSYQWESELGDFLRLEIVED